MSAERKLAILAYLPPNTPRWHTQTFLENLREHKTENDIILFSDSNYDASGIVKRPEDFIKISDPEKKIRNSFPDRQFNVNNLLFLTALRIASQSARGYTHMLFLEADVRARSRNGIAWDSEIWDEFCAKPGSPMVGGSIAIRNPQSMDAEGQRRAAELTAKNTRPNFPVTVRGSATDTAPFLFVYGAGGIYELASMASLIPFENTVQTAQSIPAWDFHTGKEIWKQFGNESFDMIRNLECIFSGYGEKTSTEAERREMLSSSRVVLSHQHKNNWRPT